MLQVWWYIVAHWDKVWGFLYGNKLIIGLFITSAVRVAPVPGQPWTLYTFLYDWAHQFLNITNTRLTKEPVVSPPVNGEQSGRAV
jgi:hypothetical protein